MLISTPNHGINIAMDAAQSASTNVDGIFSDGDSSTWGERLLFNLLSYSLVIVPIIVVIISTRYKLCPGPLQHNYIILWFVYGANNNRQSSRSNDINLDGDDKSLLLNEVKQKDRNKTAFNSANTLAFSFCLLGLQISYLIWGYLQEKIMTTSYEINGSQSTNQHSTNNPNQMHLANSDISQRSSIVFHDSQFLVFINRIVAFILAILALVYSSHQQSMSISNPNSPHIYKQQQQSTKPNAPLYEYIYSSLSNILSSWCQYEALKYVNFPTQCLSKSCKVIPVMLMSKILLNKKYKLYDYLCALLLAAGMFIFLLNQPVIDKHNRKDQILHKNDQIDFKSSRVKISPRGNLTYNEAARDKFEELSTRVGIRGSLASGLVILALYLTFDSFTSNWQQSLYSRYQISNWQMMAAINFYSILLTLTSLHQLGNLTPAFILLSKSNQLLRDCLLMSIMSSIGQMFVYYTIKRFGSVIFAVIMTLRQFLSILLSCAIYGHALTWGSTAGLVLVFAVVVHQTWYRSKKSNATKEIKYNPVTRFESLNKL